MRIEDLELSLDSIKLLEKNTLKRYKIFFNYVYVSSHEFFNWISLKCFFSVGLLTIVYSIALFRTVDVMLRALHTQLWQKKQWMK